MREEMKMVRKKGKNQVPEWRGDDYERGDSEAGVIEFTEVVQLK